MTSASVAHLLRQWGFNAFVLVGGLAAWRKRGNPLETVPATDVVHLPTSAGLLEYFRVQPPAKRMGEPASAK